MIKGFFTLFSIFMLLAVSAAATAGGISGAEPSDEPGNAVAYSGKTYTDPITGMEFVLVRGGCYQMGSPATEVDRDDDEGPIHKVCVDDFYIGKYEVTQSQYQKITGSNPSYFKGKNRPVEKVSWNDAQSYIAKLNNKSGKSYRLPTEAEWEYAARSGGRGEKWAGTNSESSLGNYAWYNSNSGIKTHSVGRKRANGLGLYDMSGNVWEWCSDWYEEDYYKQSPWSNPQGPSTGSYRVFRSGCWSNDKGSLRSASRYRNFPDNRYYYLGFRLVLPAVRSLF